MNNYYFKFLMITSISLFSLYTPLTQSMEKEEIDEESTQEKCPSLKDFDIEIFKRSGLGIKKMKALVNKITDTNPLTITVTFKQKNNEKDPFSRQVFVEFLKRKGVTQDVIQLESEQPITILSTKPCKQGVIIANSTFCIQHKQQLLTILDNMHKDKQLKIFENIMKNM